MEQFVQLLRRDAAHLVRRSEETASGLMQTLAYSAQSIAKKSRP
jgi:IS4 transposase